MSKITRRTYKRKKIVMGLALFGAIGLVSTGFAAWVLSASAQNKQSPNIKVGEVSDKSMEFDQVKIYGLVNDATDPVETSNYSFNPRFADNTGRVRFGSNDGADEGERMSLTVRGQIKEAQNLGKLKVSFDSIPDKLQQAVTAGYVNLPACAAEGGVEIPFTPYTGTGSYTMDFEYAIAFTWGDAFGGVNPGDYYDDDANGKLVPIADVKTTLEAMHALLDDVQFSVTFEAIPN